MLRAALTPLLRSRAARAVALRAARVPGLGVLTHWLARRALPRGSRIWGRVAAGPGAGLWLRLEPRYEVEYWQGAHELPVQRLLRESLRPGDVFYDVGAHLGFFSMIAARLVGPRGSVVALEPDPENAARLREHARRNELGNIEVIECAAWSEEATLEFHRALDTSSRNMGSVMEEIDFGGECLRVAAAPLDRIAAGRLHPHLVKMDIEGAEAAAVSGALELLRSARPLFCCEVHSPDAARDVRAAVEALGYVVESLSAGDAFPAQYLCRP